MQLRLRSIFLLISLSSALPSCSTASELKLYWLYYPTPLKKSSGLKWDLQNRVMEIAQRYETKSQLATTRGLLFQDTPADDQRSEDRNGGYIAVYIQDDVSTAAITFEAWKNTEELLMRYVHRLEKEQADHISFVFSFFLDRVRFALEHIDTPAVLASCILRASARTEVEHVLDLTVAYGAVLEKQPGRYAFDGLTTSESKAICQPHDDHITASARVIAMSGGHPHVVHGTVLFSSSDPRGHQNPHDRPGRLELKWGDVTMMDQNINAITPSAIANRVVEIGDELHTAD